MTEQPQSMSLVGTRKEPDRDQWGRPKVIPPTGGKPVGYTRATTVAGAIDDQTNLTKWKLRSATAGLGQRPDLHLRAASLGFEPADADELKRWKKEMNEVWDKALEAGKASSKATIGSAIHEYTEKLDRGQPLGYVPPEYEPHLKAYEEATKDFRSVHVERFCVLDELQIGGTPDRVLQMPGQDKLIIGDVKSGNISYAGKIAMQLAIYAHSLLYDIDTGQRSPLGDIDQEWGLIVALSATTGKCDLVWVDLAAGWRAVQIAMQARAWQKYTRPSKDGTSKITRPYEHGIQDALPQSAPAAQTSQPPTEQQFDQATEAALANAIAAAATPDQLIRLWQAAGPRWTDQHTQMAAQRKAQLAA